VDSGLGAHKAKKEAANKAKKEAADKAKKEAADKAKNTIRPISRGQYKRKYDPIEFGREMDVAISGFFVVGTQLPAWGQRKALLAASMGLKSRSTKFCAAWDQLKDHKFRRAKQ
jgi:hypothetical protein